MVIVVIMKKYNEKIKILKKRILNHYRNIISNCQIGFLQFENKKFTYNLLINNLIYKNYKLDKIVNFELLFYFCDV